MLWLNPLALFALAAVAAPILIHILDPAAGGALSVSDAAVPAADAARGDPPPPARGRRAARGPRRAARGGGRRAGGPAARHRRATSGVGSRASCARSSSTRSASRAAPLGQQASDGPGAVATSRPSQAASLADGIRRAVLWLDAAPPARREIVIASPFPIGSITQADVAAVPAGHRRPLRADRHAAQPRAPFPPDGC